MIEFAVSCIPAAPRSLVVDAGVIATALGALVFVCCYAWMTRGAWRSTAVGQNVMVFMAVILVVSALAVTAIFLGSNWPGRTLIRALAWWSIAGCIWWRVLILRRVQRDHTHKPATAAQD